MITLRKWHLTISRHRIPIAAKAPLHYISGVRPKILYLFSLIVTLFLTFLFYLGIRALKLNYFPSHRDWTLTEGAVNANALDKGDQLLTWQGEYKSTTSPPIQVTVIYEADKNPNSSLPFDPTKENPRPYEFKDFQKIQVKFPQAKEAFFIKYTFVPLYAARVLPKYFSPTYVLFVKAFGHSFTFQYSYGKESYTAPQEVFDDLSREIEQALSSYRQYKLKKTFLWNLATRFLQQTLPFHTSKFLYVKKIEGIIHGKIATIFFNKDLKYLNHIQTKMNVKPEESLTLKFHLFERRFMFLPRQPLIESHRAAGPAFVELQLPQYYSSPPIVMTARAGQEGVAVLNISKLANPLRKKFIIYVKDRSEGISGELFLRYGRKIEAFLDSTSRLGTRNSHRFRLSTHRIDVNNIIPKFQQILMERYNPDEDTFVGLPPSFMEGMILKYAGLTLPEIARYIQQSLDRSQRLLPRYWQKDLTSKEILKMAENLLLELRSRPTSNPFQPELKIYWTDQDIPLLLELLTIAEQSESKSLLKIVEACTNQILKLLQKQKDPISITRSKVEMPVVLTESLEPRFSLFLLLFKSYQLFEFSSYRQAALMEGEKIIQQQERRFDTLALYQFSEFLTYGQTAKIMDTLTHPSKNMTKNKTNYGEILQRVRERSLSYLNHNHQQLTLSQQIELLHLFLPGHAIFWPRSSLLASAPQ